MPRIQQLDTTVVTKIAAGEVIERPASVVKELLENSVDAGSTRIDIDIEQGGSELIRLVDNGCGIEPDDLPLAFASHATSKLATADDLFQIRTLGFRGEALASIGGVSQVSLQSRPPERAQGAEIQCQGGTLSPVKPWNGSGGTRIEVRHLFYNTPVRKKFLKSISTEVGHVSEAFTRLALAHPHLHLVLRHNGKMVYEVTGGPRGLHPENLKERIGLFFGAEIRDQLYAVEAVQGGTTLRGMIADPGCERGNARMQYLFLNGRWIRDRSIGHALQEAYRGLLMTGRYAVAFLFLEVPPDQVDVNVHPTKAEVRFQNSQAIYHLVYSALKERLRQENLVPRLQVSAAPLAPPQAQGIGAAHGASDPPPWALNAPPPPQPGLPFTSIRSAQAEAPLVGLGRQPFPPPPPPAPRGPSRVADPAPAPLVHPEPTPAPPPPVSAPEWPTAAEVAQQHDPAKVIQLYDSYLVLETPEGMLVIDQHALHERILFEQLKKRLRLGALETQRLLIPEPVELSAEQAARTLEQKDALRELGLEIEDLGGGTLLLSSYPAILGRRPPHAILKAVVDHLMTKDRLPTREVLLGDLLSLMACHAAVRAGDHLSPEEMSALLAQRHLADDTHHCPHGRPTALLFTRHDLERQFRRV